MFTTLVESRPATTRRPGGAVLSFIVHYGLVLAAIYTSAQAATVSDGPRQEKIAFVEPPKPEVEPERAPPELVVAPRPPQTTPLLIAPVEIPSVLPEIDLTHRVTDPNEFTHPGPRSTEPPTPGATGSAVEPTEYFAFQLENPAMLAPNSATPIYPERLRQAGVEGEALVSFVVDTTGRVDLGTFKVVRATHDQFLDAVRKALPKMRFIPAELGNRKVRQLVQQPYSFAIRK
jgi:protein TonB